jgi:hypothetical protein
MTEEILDELEAAYLSFIIRTLKKENPSDMELRIIPYLAEKTIRFGGVVLGDPPQQP